jgi:cytochrome c-type biogenesis protein CcmH/NrfG
MEPAADEVSRLFDDASGDVAIGDLEAAAAKYRRCVELDPTFFEGWHALGMALMRHGELKAALGPALMATDLKPNDLLAWTALSQIYVKLGQIADAETAKANARILSLGGKVVKDAS